MALFVESEARVNPGSVHACGHCGGTGIDPAAPDWPCGECDATGRVRQSDAVRPAPGRTRFVYVATVLSEPIDSNDRLLTLVEDLIDAFADLGCVALWEVEADQDEDADCWCERSPRLVGAIRPGPSGKPAVVWL